MRFGALLLTGLLAGSLMPENGGAQVGINGLPYLAAEVYAALPDTPVIQCSLSPGSASPGQSVEVTTRVVNGDTAGLRYSFEASAGKLTVTGSTARLDTSGVTAEEISVTCVVVDAHGRRVSNGSTVRLVKQKKTDTVIPGQRFPTQPGAVPMTHPTEAPRGAMPPPPPPPPVMPPPQQPATPPPVEAKKPSQRLGVKGLGAGGGGSGAGVGRGARVGLGAVKNAATPDAGNKEYAEGLAIQQWEKELKTGKIEYNLPTKMSLPDATTVSVVVHGYEDVNGQVQAGAQSAALKVSQRMRVTLSAEENPDEFKIERDGTDEVQLVPIDGTARWQWKVTPKEPAADQKLTIRALLVYPDDPNKADVQITSYTAEISVQVGSLWEWIKYLFWNDPVGLLKYLLPGGAGFAFVAGLVAWWWKRRHPEKKEEEK